MTDDNFIARWSRLKREAESEKRRVEKPGQGPPEAHTEQPAAGAAHAAPPGEARGAGEPPFDPTTLPSIDSIVAGTDIRAFLQKGVPAELTKAALRRAWSTDPAIRDFIEIAENQWDFTDPTSIPGFGPLRAGDDVRQLVSQAMGKLSEAPPAALDEKGLEENRNHPSATAPAGQSRPPIVAEAAASARSEHERANDQDALAIAASQHAEPASDKAAPPRRKGHGAAMPR
jgi:Protein of unknown function (DUF3306)